MTDWYGWQGETLWISPDERGFHYGDGLFETVAIRNGTPRLWNLHIDRMNSGCERLGLVPPDGTSLERIMAAALDGAGPDGIVKLIVTAGEGERGYGRPMSQPAKVYAARFPWPAPEAAASRDGVSTMLCKTRLATGSPLAGLKTLNRLEQVLARSECLAKGVFEGLTQDAEGRLICGTMSNVFFVKDNAISTPSLERCGVAGVMRRLVLETLGEQGRYVDIGDLSLADLRAADEVFLTNSQFGVLPVKGCDELAWPVGTVTRDVMDLLAARGIDECR
jgi:4-amino-4-deoxychorismate lyase